LKASERKITKLFSESDTVFSIPVYQRDYNWQEKQCQRLFKDILQTGKNEKVSSYFLGSIVYIHDGIYGVGEKEFHVIDGQQRMTTLTLLFLAIYFKLKGTILAKDADKIYNQYVVNPYSEKEIKLKLLPPEENLYILNKISHNKFNELEAFQDRNMLKNYLFFEKELESLSFDDMKYLSNGIEKLIYIDIALEKGKDDPQKIFESLNSTGLDLSQGDLIRNYILMDLERGEQNRIYKEIWIPIENNCKVSDGSEITSYVSDFIRDYLTLKTEKISSKPKVFETFKAYYEKENDEKLEDMKKYSEAYSYIIKPSLEKDKDIQRELDYLKSLDEATEYIQAKINEIPEESRYLITAHDAFAYFAEQFGLQVKAIQGVSTDSEIGTKQIEDLATFIVEHKIKAIFVESSVNHKSIEALQEAVKAKGGNVEIGGELYSDSMGDKENNTETYIKTIKANADTIANALK